MEINGTWTLSVYEKGWLELLLGFGCRGKGVDLGMTVKSGFEVSEVILGGFLVRNFPD